MRNVAAPLDLARRCFDALVGAPGITAEAREYRNDDSLTDEQALHVILEARFGHMSDRDAYAACARRYDVVLPGQFTGHDADGMACYTGVAL